jgi:hypothetical protein
MHRSNLWSRNLLCIFSEEVFKKWSVMQDSNLRPLGPKPSALPSCANHRHFITFSFLLQGEVKNGVAKGTWTLDNRNHNPGLYQLSYSHHWTYLKRLLIRRAEYIALIRRLTRKTFAFYCIYTWLLMFYTICATNQQLTYLFYFIPLSWGAWCRRIS